MTKITFSEMRNKVTPLPKSESYFQRESSISWLDYLIPPLRVRVEAALHNRGEDIEEIRLRVNRPLILRIGSYEYTIDEKQQLTENLFRGHIITRDEIERTMQVLSQCSLYAWEDELKNGYITIPGGHRVGLVGKGVLDKGRIKTLKDVSGINYRIGKEVKGCANKLMPLLIKDNKVLHTLIISPPQCGKTTLLRDVIRQLSDGVTSLNFSGVNVGLVDERSELAGMFQGQPQFDIGLRTDVLDACPKAQGMMMMIRSMSPVVLATDEIGMKEDVQALYHSLQAGVSVITTVHGQDYQELQERPVLQELINLRFFNRLVILSRKKGVGTLDAIWDGKTLERMR